MIMNNIQSATYALPRENMVSNKIVYMFMGASWMAKVKGTVVQKIQKN
jgi:hypothetical protein